MTRKSYSVIALLIAWTCLVCEDGHAQVPPDKLDIIGLKLGMTMEDAKATLRSYNKNIKMTVDSLSFYNKRIDLSNRVRPQLSDVRGGSADSSPGKEFVPIELDASLVTHAYDMNNSEIADKTSSDPIYSVSGEFLALYFTPTDMGGHLYAIGRTVLDKGINETDVQLLKQFTDKYGQPSSPSTLDPEWMYDVRGRFLRGTNKDFKRCVQFMQRPQPSQNGAGGFEFSLKDYNTFDAPSSRLVLDYGLRFRMDTTASNLKQCGTQFDLEIANSTGDHVAGFFERLFDQTAAFFDDGSEGYLKKKAIELYGPATASAPPKL